MTKRIQLFWALVFLLLPQMAEAASFIKDKQNYTAMLTGKATIQFSLPTFDYWSLSGNVYVTDDSYIEATCDGSTKKIFWWKSEGDEWSDRSWAWAEDYGTFIVIREHYGSEYDNRTLKPGEWSKFMLGADLSDGDHKTMKVNWEVPYEWQGKKIRLRANVVWTETTGNGDPMDISLGEFATSEPPTVNVMLMDPMLAFEKGHVNEIILPYSITARKVNSIAVHYTDRISGEDKSMVLSSTALSGYVYMPADRALKDLYLKCNIVDNDGNTLDIESERIKMPPLHQAVDFTATLEYSGQVTLTWKVENAELEDIVETDYWEIQRNLSGNSDDDDSGWMTIGQISYEAGEKAYSYVDEDYLNSYQGREVYYRIRRMATSMWGWSKDTGRKLCQQTSPLYLTQMTSGKVAKAADWGDNFQHRVNISWTSVLGKLGDVLGKDGKVYENASSAKDHGGGIWGVVVCGKPLIVWTANKSEIKSADYATQTYRQYYLDHSSGKLKYVVPSSDFHFVYPDYSYLTKIVKGYGGQIPDAPRNNFNFTSTPLLEALDDLASDGVEGIRGGNFFLYKDTIWSFNMSGTMYDPITTGFGVSFMTRGWAVYDEKSRDVWDSRAKLLLYIDMKNDAGEIVATECRDLSGDTAVINKGQYTLQLTRKCVDYDFRLVMKRGTSPLHFRENGADSLEVKLVKQETGADVVYKFMNNDSIVNLVAKQQQSTVELSWSNTGGDNDFYRVLRREHGVSDSEPWDTLATGLTQLFFIDKKPRPQHVYDYRVESVLQCEGLKISGQTVTGQCAPTGMVRGYVRLADGTGLGGLTVTAEPIGNIVGATIATAVTDSTGFFELSGLIYQQAGSYRISVASMGDAGSFEPQTVSFDDEVNLRNNFIFTINTYYIYSGNVYYEGSTIPVPGVQFRRDGVLMVNANQQPIVTDNQGSFSLSIPKGTHRVQAVKEGHQFKNDGYLQNPDSQTGDLRDYNWAKDVSTVRLWDQTRVVLRGRLVGGNEQGQLPLGQSLSKNNLGDSLKIVLMLEGDNTSYITYDPLDPTKKERTDVIVHGRTDTTSVRSNRRSITICPDEKSGEYQLSVYPVKYKVTEVSATGYSTLFQEGKVGETLDLTAYQQGDTAVYSRIYHSVPSLDVIQFNPTGENYYGVKQYQSQDNIGNKTMVSLWDSEAGYSFGNPVFMAGSPYGWVLQAVERYYFNNDSRREADVVKLKGGEVTFSNGLVSSTTMNKVELDSLGGGSYVFTPQNTTFTLEDDKAVKTVSITLLYDGTYFDVQPIKGYVMASIPKSNGNRMVVKGIPHLIDILRDPPGGGSSAYMEQGSKLSYSYSANIDASAGFDISKETGSGANYYTGVIGMAGVTGTEAGNINNVKTTQNFSVTLATYFGWSWNYSYAIDLNERIETSSGKKWIGPKADLFIGMTDNIVLQDAVAVRVIPENIYKLMTTHQGGTFNTSSGMPVTVKNGTMKVLATGHDPNGKPIYLIRDEVLGVSMNVSSSFVHSQYHIENEILPNLMRIRNSLILPKGTTPDYAQALANKQGFSSYVSNVDENDKLFGLSDANDKPTYTQYYPTGIGKSAMRDSIAALNNEAACWLRFLMKNEEEKLTATDLVKNYDFDGAASVQYAENFSFSGDRTRYLRWPIMNNFGGGFSQLLGPIGNLLEKVFSSGNVRSEPYTVGSDDVGSAVADISVVGSSIKLKFKPILSANFNDKNGINESWSKKVGFKLSVTPKSMLNVDVYRTKSSLLNISNEDTADNIFYSLTKDYLDKIRNGKVLSSGFTNSSSFMDQLQTPVYSSFVYRTRGGATASPYEDERLTKYYNPGTVLDAKTIELHKLRIWTEQASVSNVPFDEPARFTLYLANESEMPDNTTPYFKLAVDNKYNQKGAKIMVDGNVLNGDGYTVALTPNEVLTKQIEVYPGEAFDYENLAITLYDPDDDPRTYNTYISAHFVPSAGKVKVTAPGGNWVVNTESSYDAKQQAYFLPVRIEGFDVNYRGFDHIELQYKLSTQGDNDWVNICSFYNDRTLMAQASGVVDSIPSNGAIQTRFFGEKDPIEQRYDLRAVVYCRYGNGFLTAASPILSGIKDTRRPVPFGTPEPQNGILGIGDDIKISFSEAIAGNYLSTINNFEVLGTPVSKDISLSTQLGFTGNTWAMSKTNCNLTGKSFTVDVMLNPAKTDENMIVFSHNGYYNGANFGLTPDHRLIARIAGEEVTSQKPIPFNGIRQVAYSLQQETDSMLLSLYDGSSLVGQKRIAGIYQINDALWIGCGGDDTFSNYQGEMLEFRLWNRSLSAAELGEYAQKTLTGYEYGLLDNYPMNEGTGSYTYDRAVGANDLELTDHVWKRPDGISIALDGTEGVRLQPDRFSRTDYQDYTLMFWFRTDDEEATLMANGEATTEVDARNHFNIGLQEGEVVFRSGNREIKTNSIVNDNSWHHYAMTVSRSRNVGNVYIDKNLVKSFAVDTLGGIMGNNLALGATYTSSTTCERVLKGNIDEVAMFESVLPLNLLQTYATQTPTGKETALMAYLDFGRSELQDDGTQRLMPTGISLKRYKDAQGNVIAQRNDTLIVQSVVEAHVDRRQYAPMTSTRKLDNVRFSYVANNNDLLINLDVPDFQIEKSNVYVTVRDVPDLNGNTMASPLTMNLYVYRNPLRWNVKRVNRTIDYGVGDAFTVTVQNLSGQQQSYELHDLPFWLSASKTQGTISAQDEETITFEASPYMNIGTYNEVVSLISESDMNEPLPVTVTVTGEEPDWAVSNELKNQNGLMHIVARVTIDKRVSTDRRDMLSAFGPSQEVMGVAHVEVDQTANANDALTYLTVYGNPKENTPLNFRFYDASTGKTHILYTQDNQDIKFYADSILGSSAQPVLLKNILDEVQTIDLAEGWNWVSVKVALEDSITVGSLLNGAAKWEEGDAIEVVSQGKANVIYCWEADNTWHYKWDKEDQLIDLDPRIMYRVYSNSPKKVCIRGAYSYCSIDVKQGWNRIGYQSPINLPISQAMSEYTMLGSEGDVLKSQDAFAILSKNGSGQLIWKGSLLYMEQGKGYMLKRKDAKPVSFMNPLYYNDNRYAGAGDTPNMAPLFDNRTATTMTMVAKTEGVELQAGDRLMAYVDGQLCGMAESQSDGSFYMNIGSADTAPLVFCIERDGKTIAAVKNGMNYTADAMVGSPAEPTVIRFTNIDNYTDGHWYTLDGHLLEKQPQRKGFYIHNGKIEIIKR